MFDFKNGMLGVVIIALAIAGSLFGSYLAGIDTEQVEVTKYNYLADVSGLFQYDESPQYIEFDPSTNYTGYYSENSYSDAMNKYYFAVDEVDFKPSANVNNYATQEKPLIGEDVEADLTNVTTGQLNNYHRIRWVYNADGDYQDWINKPLNLKTYIESLNIDPQFTNLRISMSDEVDWDAQPSSGLYHPITLDAYLIIPSGWFFNDPWITYTVTYMANPNLDLEDLVSIGHTVNKPFKSFDVNLSTWRVMCYSDTGLKGSWVEYQADSLLLCSGDTYYVFDIDDVNLTSTLTYQETEAYPKKYLDPNDGVWLKDGE